MTYNYLESDAVISDCGTYRWWLSRIWDRDRPRVSITGLNPSKADAETNDATIRSDTRLLDALGFGGFEKTNLYGFRVTDPSALLRTRDPTGRENFDAIRGAVDRCDTVVAAWGANPMASDTQIDLIWEMLRRNGSVYCFGTTKSGAPKHPLYLKTGTPLVVYGR